MNESFTNTQSLKDFLQNTEDTGYDTSIGDSQMSHRRRSNAFGPGTVGHPVRNNISTVEEEELEQSNQNPPISTDQSQPQDANANKSQPVQNKSTLNAEAKDFTPEKSILESLTAGLKSFVDNFRDEPQVSTTNTRVNSILNQNKERNTSTPTRDGDGTFSQFAGDRQTPMSAIPKQADTRPPLRKSTVPITPVQSGLPHDVPRKIIIPQRTMPEAQGMTLFDFVNMHSLNVNQLNWILNDLGTGQSSNETNTFEQSMAIAKQYWFNAQHSIHYALKLVDLGNLDQGTYQENFVRQMEGNESLQETSHTSFRSAKSNSVEELPNPQKDQPPVQKIPTPVRIPQLVQQQPLTAETVLNQQPLHGAVKDNRYYPSKFQQDSERVYSTNAPAGQEGTHLTPRQNSLNQPFQMPQPSMVRPQFVPQQIQPFP